MKTLFLILSVLLSMNTFAISGDALKVEWEKTLLPFYQGLKSGELKNSQGLKLSYKYLVKSSNKFALVILPGQGEPALKYAEVIYDLRNSGHDLYILDHQGQGLSQRLLKDSQKGHVISFGDYVSDLDLFLRKVVQQHSVGKDLHLLAHSMGGAIGVLYLSENPGVFKKAILNAPMLKINTSPYPEKVARLLGTLLVKIGKGENYAPGKGPYRPSQDHFESNPFTSSLERHSVTKKMNEMFPDLVVGGPTSRWVDQSLKATKFILNKAKDIKIPLLLFQAGLDQIVRTPIQQSFCESAPQCIFVTFPNAQHEILMERDTDRDEALSEIAQFLSVTL